MYRITVRGIVQGVGFRPFVYRIAKSMGLKGYVKNTGTGCVEIVIDRNVKEFIERLRRELPPVANLQEVNVEEIEAEQFKDFKIVKSGGKKGKLSLPPPDIAVCKDCINEVFNEKDRRYMYAFTSCTNCGPRFSVALRLPYDRENTTFSEFPMCEDCLKEYWNVEDRRYYAQTIVCPKCGPEYRLLNKELIASGVEAIKKAAKLIDEGKIVALKGVGGFHIACKVEDEVVFNLRKRLSRPQQPFAVMVRDVKTAEEIAYISKEEKKALESYAKPIVVLKSKKELKAVAPGLNTVGVMLPYTPLHHIIFSFMKSNVIVMTSANMPGEPMFIDDEIVESGLADYYLTHNLRIANRIDDSVVKFVGRKKMIIRKSRGFIPDRIQVPLKDVEAIALGAELYNSISVLKDSYIIQSQYIGNTGNFKTYKEFFCKAFEFWLSFTKLKPEVVLCDMHPIYNTTTFAESLPYEVLKVQHHFCHALSVMAERGIKRAVAIAVDGAGYGFDGKTWGCEVLWLDLDGEFERIARMEYIPLPGGDKATEYPGRILYSLVDVDMDWKSLNVNPDLIDFQLKKKVNIAEASSAGRYLDVCSVLLGAYRRRTYEGEGAMKLESIALNGNREVAEMWLRDNPVKIKRSVEKAVYSTPFEGCKVKEREVKVIKIRDVIASAAEDLKNLKREDLALALTLYLSKALSEVAVEEAISRNSCIVMSGGVSYNSIITPEIAKNAKNSGVDFYTNELTAAGDNGISVGQIYSLMVKR